MKSESSQPDSTWTTDPLWLKRDGEYYFYQNDHLGTPQKLVKQNGAVVWSASYTAFGQATVEVETITNNLRFPGQYYDAETGLHYNFHRYYAPEIGRYVRVDPNNLASIQHQYLMTSLLNPEKQPEGLPSPNALSTLVFGHLSNISSKLEIYELFERSWVKELISNPLQLNHYVYCHGNSVMSIDPQGLRRLSDCQIAKVEQFLFCIVGGVLCVIEPTKATCTAAFIWCVWSAAKVYNYCSDPCPS